MDFDPSINNQGLLTTRGFFFFFFICCFFVVAPQGSMDHKVKAAKSLCELPRPTPPVLQTSLTSTFVVLMNSTKAVGSV